MSGTWYCAWQTWKDNVPRIDVHSLEVHQSGDLLPLHPHGTYAWGRWVGMSYDGEVITGWGAIARTNDEAHRVVKDLVSTEKP